MKKLIKRIKTDIYDKLNVASLTQNKTLYNDICKQYEDNMYEEIEVDIPNENIINNYDEIKYIDNLLNKELDEHGEGIYAGINEGHMYSFDFTDKTVTISNNLINNYVFFPEYKRVWFFTDLYRKTFLYVNYETGEIIDYVGPDENKEKIQRVFKYQQSLDLILEFSGAKSLEALFNFYFE